MQITFRKLALFVCLLCMALLFLTTRLFAQDTIYCRKVRIANHVGISMKDGHVMYARPIWRKVKCGFIVRLRNGDWLIDGKVKKPGDNKPLKIRK